MKKILLSLLIIAVSFTSYAQNLPSVSGTATLQVNNNGTVGTATPGQIVSAAGVTGTISSVSVPTGLLVGGAASVSTGAASITVNMAAGPVRSTGVSGSLTSGAISLTTEVSGLLPNANLANSTIVLATPGTTGTDIAWASSPVALGATATLNVPDASATARGVITVGNQTIGSSGTTKTFAGNAAITGVATMNGGVTSGGQKILTPTTLTTATTLVAATSNEKIIADATTAAFTITLPTTPATGTKYSFVKKNVTTNSVTLAAGGANTINGLATFVIYTGRNVYEIEFDGADWSTVQ